MHSGFNVVDSFDTHARGFRSILHDVDEAANEEWSCWNYFRRLGSGNVLPEPYVCKCDSYQTEKIIHSGAKV